MRSMYICTLEEFISSRCSHIAVQVRTEDMDWNLHWFIYNCNNRRERMRNALDVQLTH